ncbi:MAG TPA: hypothetical protein VFC00_00265 [Micromonosporaceae bacterium]|nr:hypothetical protein [Micromonosporaceae bacterium]
MFADDVHRVLGQLSTMTGRLPRLLEQLDTILARLLPGQDLAVSGGEHDGDPFAAIDRAGDTLGLAVDLADVLARQRGTPSGRSPTSRSPIAVTARRATAPRNARGRGILRLRAGPWPCQ